MNSLSDWKSNTDLSMELQLREVTSLSLSIVCAKLPSTFLIGKFLRYSDNLQSASIETIIERRKETAKKEKKPDLQILLVPMCTDVE